MRKIQCIVIAICLLLSLYGCVRDDNGVSGAESPCDVFGQIEFPMDAFFPSKNDACIPPSQSCTGCARTE